MKLHKLVPLTLFICLLLGSVLAEEATMQHTRSTSPHFEGTKWAILVAGSKGYLNYRHQADVCHAYQVLKRAGLKDKNIIVFMYDDIANNEKNPRKGVIINKPKGPNVYPGVPKDYTGKDVNVNNFLNVILANNDKLTGGSGKVLNSGPNDHIFIYYSDHGSPGVLGMPSEALYANEFIATLKKKYESKSYAEMVIYVEACEAGSMFNGLLPNNWNIYATTASNPSESSYATYCGVDDTYKDVCLGDLYSVSWIEDSEVSDLNKRTLNQQYTEVKKRTRDSHVMEYGDISLSRNILSAFMGSARSHHAAHNMASMVSNTIDQRDVELYLLHSNYKKAQKGSEERRRAIKELSKEIVRRKTVDKGMKNIVKKLFLFGSKMNSSVMENNRSEGQPLVDDWNCLKNFMKIYEQHCGKLSVYGLKYTRVMANMCNAGVNAHQMSFVAAQTCNVVK